MNFFKRMIGLGGDLDSQVKNSKFQATFYKVIKGARNIIFAQCTITFHEKNSAYFISLQHKQEAYQFPIYLQMNPVTFSMNKNGKEHACFQWTLQQDNQHVGCYMHPDNKNKFKQILCQILKKVVNDQNIKDHLDFCKQLKGIPIYKQSNQSQLSNSSKISVSTKEQLNAVLMKQAAKAQNKIVHTALCYQIIKNQRKLIQQSAVFALRSIGNFSYEFDLINQTGYCFLKKEITPGLVYEINTDAGYLKWLQLDKQYSKIIEINFQGRRDAAMSLKFALMQCMYQINTKRKLTDAVAEDQMTYLKRINQNTAQRNINMSIVKVYSQKQDIENIEQKNFVYGNQEAKKGLQRYKAVTQAKIGDFDLTSLGSMLQTLRIDQDNQIKSISHHRIFGKQNIQVDPTILLLHDNDNKVMALQRKGNLVYHDLNKQKLINQYKIDQKGLIEIHPQYKLAQTNPFHTFKAISSNSIYQIDPRLKEGSQLSKQYTTTPNFNTMSVDQKGNYALGSSSGEIRLYNKIGSNANCKYSSFGDKVLHLESTKDGKWLLATFSKFLILLPTQTEEEQSLYQKKIPFTKRLDPIKLTIKLQHLQLCKVHDLQFIPAKFDESKANRQKYIVGGFGQYVVIWNLSQVLKGDYWNYKFTKTSGKILQADFKYNDVKKLIMVNNNGINVKQNKLRPS